MDPTGSWPSSTSASYATCQCDLLLGLQIWCYICAMFFGNQSIGVSQGGAVWQRIQYT